MAGVKKTAILYRMVMKEHICPFGLKSRDLLRRQGFHVEDHWLTSRAEVDAFKEMHHVETTPQTFINDKRIGGYDDLRRHFGKKVKDKDAITYWPVLAIFALAALMAAAAHFAAFGAVLSLRLIEWFIAFAMCLLALQKLRDVENFANMFLGYDLLAQKQPRYAYVYPYAEGLAGVLMIAGVWMGLAIALAFFIGTIGAASVFKAVYLDRRKLKCACVGGDSKVPLGFVSLSENLMMIGMSVWMVVKQIG